MCKAGIALGRGSRDGCAQRGASTLAHIGSQEEQCHHQPNRADGGHFAQQDRGYWRGDGVTRLLGDRKTALEGNSLRDVADDVGGGDRPAEQRDERQDSRDLVALWGGRGDQIGISTCMRNEKVDEKCTHPGDIRHPHVRRQSARRP